MAFILQYCTSNTSTITPHLFVMFRQQKPTRSPTLELCYVPWGPCTHEVRVTVNNHINRYTQRLKRRRSDRRASKNQPQNHISAISNPSSTIPSDHRHDEGRVQNHRYHTSLYKIGPTYRQPVSIRVEIDGAQWDLQYALDVFWPGFDPGGKISESPFVSNRWIYEATHDSTLLYSFLWAASFHNFATGRSPTVATRMMKYYDRLVRCLADDMKTTERASSDAVLLSILSLHPDQQTTLPFSRIPEDGFKPPFRHLQSLDLYTHQPLSKIHSAALLRLVNGRGGLDSLRLPGLRLLLQYTDLLYASMNLEAPRLPLCADYQAHQNATKAEQPRLTTGPGLTHLPTSGLQYLRDFDINPLIIGVLLDIREYLVMLESIRYSHDANEESLSQLVRRRNVLQHQVLSILNIYLPPTALISLTLQKAILTFALGVTFPIVSSEGLQRVASQLKASLLQLSFDFKVLIVPEFYLWLCMIGALAAKSCSDSALYSWFLNELCELKIFVGAEKSNLPNILDHQPRVWMEIQSVLAEYLWLSVACNDGAEAIWQDVVENLTSTSICHLVNDSSNFS